MAASVCESLWSRILESSPKLSKVLATKKYYKKMFLVKQVLRKVLSFCLDFLSNKFYIQNANAELVTAFLLNFIRPNSNNVFNINKPAGLKFLVRFRIDFSHLKEHKFRHSFQDSVDPSQLKERPFWANWKVLMQVC